MTRVDTQRRYSAADYMRLVGDLAARAPVAEVDRYRAIDSARERRDRLVGVVGLDDAAIELIVRRGLRRTPPRDRVSQWLGTTTPFLVMTGAPGIGKTVACAEMIADRGGYLITARDLERLASVKYGPLVREYETLIASPVLVVDDVGTEDVLDRMLGALVEIADKRLGHRRRTIITANGTLDHLRARYAEPRLLDRLAQHAMMVAIAAPSLRRAQLPLAGGDAR